MVMFDIKKVVDLLMFRMYKELIVIKVNVFEFIIIDVCCNNLFVLGIFWIYLVIK